MNGNCWKRRADRLRLPEKGYLKNEHCKHSIPRRLFVRQQLLVRTRAGQPPVRAT